MGTASMFFRRIYYCLNPLDLHVSMITTSVAVIYSYARQRVRDMYTIALLSKIQH